MNERHVITVLARLAARKAVKRQLQAQGLKWARFSAAEISRMAEAHMRDHPELFTEAAETVHKVPQLRTLIEPRERKRRQN